MSKPSTPPSPPPGMKYYADAMDALLQGSLYLDTIVNPQQGVPNIALPLPGSSDLSDITGAQMFGQAKRLTLKTTVGKDGFDSVASIGTAQSGLSFRWVLAPEDERALPDKQPLPTLLHTGESQRFTMMDVEFRLDEAGENTFDGFGTGRTYPTEVDGETQLWVGACGKILSGRGVFADVQGTFVLNGTLTPPGELCFELLIRILDPAPGLTSIKPLRGLDNEKAAKGAEDQLGGGSFTTFLGAPDPAVPIQQDFTPDGRMLGASVTELLRVVRLEYDLGKDGTSLRAHYAVDDWIAGRLVTKIRFNPFDPSTPGTPESPMPWRTEETTITFFDPKGKVTGTIGANVDEGRGFLATYEGFPAPVPVFNLVGFGPFAGGTGRFSNAHGMLSVNAGVSVDPGTLSNMYVLRLADASSGSA